MATPLPAHAAGTFAIGGELQVHRLGENVGAASIELSEDELADLP